MLNRVILMGRITHDLELKNTQSGIAVLSFTIAVDRSYAKEGEDRQTDFIQCVAWRNYAMFIEKYFGKGRMIAVEGHLQTRTYEDKNGTKHYITEVIVDKVSFTGELKKDSSSNGTVSSNEVNQPNPPQDCIESIGNIDDFEVVISDDGVPF